MSEPVQAVETTAGWLEAFSATLTALGTFAYENLGFTLFIGWCLFLFVSTEATKPFIERLLKKDSDDYLLAVGSMPVVLGLITGYWIFPSIMSTTNFGSAIPGWSGIGVGGMTGFFTSKIYDLTKSKKFIRLTKVIVKKLISMTPVLNKIFTEEDQLYIDLGTQRVGEGDMVTITPEMIQADLDSREIEKLEQE